VLGRHTIVCRRFSSQARLSTVRQFPGVIDEGFNENRNPAAGVGDRNQKPARGGRSMNDREARQRTDRSAFHPDRREFARIALTGTVGAGIALGSAGQKPASGRPVAPGI
jgi:hypothetical protein